MRVQSNALRRALSMRMFDHSSSCVLFEQRDRFDGKERVAYMKFKVFNGMIAGAQCMEGLGSECLTQPPFDKKLIPRPASPSPARGAIGMWCAKKNFTVASGSRGSRGSLKMVGFLLVSL